MSNLFRGLFIEVLNSFGQSVSREKIFLEIAQRETRNVYGGHVC